MAAPGMAHCDTLELMEIDGIDVNRRELDLDLKYLYTQTFTFNL